ncbi:MAG TPA: glycosyltransferase [Kiritimatiellae bacterium]|nr:glycosyltransferase [Kiritimatiellia bacterium]
MRILLISNYQPPHMGGIEFACDALRASWTRLGHGVTWLTTDIPPGAVPSTEGNIRLPAWNIAEELWEINSPLVLPWHAAFIRRLASRHDVVNIHSLAPGLSSLALSIVVRLGRPAIVTQHVGIIPLRSRLLTRLQDLVIGRRARWAVRNGIPLTFVGEAVRRWFIEHAGIPEDRTWITPAGIDRSDFYVVADEERAAARRRWNLPEDRLAVLFVGRFYQKKGMPLLEEVARRCPEMVFTFRGDGPENPTNWGLPNVNVIGYLSAGDLRLLYGAHDLLVLPSVGEGWPAVVPQAMACGLACLISEETFQGYGRDRHMFLVCQREVETIVRILREAEQGRISLLREREIISSYALENWDWDKTAAIYVELFKRVIHGK